MAGIPGIGSGIDINSIVGAMVNAEKAPKEAQLARLEKASTTKFSALGELKGALSAFQTAMKDLNSLALFEKRSATSTNASALTASASKTALAGSYQMTVERLASSSKVATAALASDFTAAADGKLTVKLGAADAGVEVDIASGDTLVQIRDKLNTALKDKGITANVINNPADGQSRLVLNAKETGAGKDISIETADAALAGLALDGSVQSTGNGAGYLQQAADAEFTVDGLALKSPSNTVDNAIPEVTLTLSGKTEADKPLTLTVDQDKSGVTANIKKFVDAYNKLIKTSNELTSVTRIGEDKPPVTGGLVGDATVRTLLGAVRNELVSPADQEGVRVLADLGITTQKDGTLKIDDTKLGKALTDNFDAVGTFFAGDTGLMSRVDKRIDGYIQTGGVLEQRMSGLQTTITGIDKQREDLTRRVAQMQARLFAQFNAMDSLVSRLNSTSDRLAQALGSLPGVVKQSS
ncbi:flagellar filament capping protein FliD [Pseudomonas benzenivorans]|uniref:Flagellar hook-associated protein 2 n=1 Tax=Pseudomonas benzenivorans TaxID=556533 RepID=A0ABZ0Q0G2_9PSED|nr:flagellar filament capping protein FliD [Pseudomonas benzenivorans]WPC06589.1 flagellar filament capping protein FliD [Pseudomonas benzenivorans]